MPRCRRSFSIRSSCGDRPRRIATVGARSALVATFSDRCVRCHRGRWPNRRNPREPRDFAAREPRDFATREPRDFAAREPRTRRPDDWSHWSQRARRDSRASAAFLREPLSRLVSLFNMYPDGTWGSAPPNATAAQRFAAAYTRRFEGRNALTCYVSGVTLCDSIGALKPGTINDEALRRARFHLTHR